MLTLVYDVLKDEELTDFTKLCLIDSRDGTTYELL